VSDLARLNTSLRDLGKEDLSIGSFMLREDLFFTATVVCIDGQAAAGREWAVDTQKM